MCVTKEDVKEKYASTVDSLNNEDAIYILNPYTNTCTPLDNPNLEQDMIISEGIAVREALVALGGKAYSYYRRGRRHKGK